MGKLLGDPKNENFKNFLKSLKWSKLAEKHVFWFYFDIGFEVFIIQLVY